MDKRATVVLLVVFGGLFVALFGFLALAYLAVKGGGGETAFGGGPGIGVVEVRGPITDGEKPLKALRRFIKNDDVKAIVLRVDSPGGAVAPSQEIHDEVLRAEKKGKPVVVSMGNLAASGGYYVSCAATRIFAEPGTLTASIGVITELPNVSGLLGELHVQVNTVKSGKLKDSGSPFREMTLEDQAYFQGVVNNVYQQFLDAVAAGRKLKVDQVKPIADGRVLTGLQAKQAGLIDALGSFSDAVAAAQSLAGIKGEPRLIYPPEEHKAVIEDLIKDGSEAAVRSVVGAVRAELGRVAPAAGPAYLMPTAGGGGSF